MRLVSVLSAKAIWLFETLEMNPLGLDMHPVYGAIRNRYGFATPKTREEVETSKDGIKFLNGSFKVDDKSLAVELTIFRDGLVAQTLSDTKHSEAFLEDAIAFAQKQYGLFFDPAMVQKRRYASNVLIESDTGLMRITKDMELISAVLTEATGRQFEATELALGFNEGGNADGLGQFSIARRAGTPFSANRFFSAAPLPTEAHIKLLEKFEAHAGS